MTHVHGSDSEPVLGIPTQDATQWVHPVPIPHPAVIPHPQTVIPHPQAPNIPHPHVIPHSEGLPLPDAYIFLFRDERDAMRWSESHGGAGVGGLVIPEPQSVPPIQPGPLLSHPPIPLHPTTAQEFVAPYHPFQQISPQYHPTFQHFTPHYQPVTSGYPNVPLPPPFHETYDVFRDQDFRSPPLFPSQSNLQPLNPGQTIPGPSRKWKSKRKKKVPSSGSTTTVGKTLLTRPTRSSDSSDQLIQKNLAGLRIDSKDKQVGGSEVPDGNDETSQGFKESQASNSEEIESFHPKEEEKQPETGPSKPIKAENLQKKASFVDAVLSASTPRLDSFQTVKDGVLPNPSGTQKLIKDKLKVGQKKGSEGRTSMVNKGKGSRVVDAQKSVVDRLDTAQKKGSEGRTSMVNKAKGSRIVDAQKSMVDRLDTAQKKVLPMPSPDTKEKIKDSSISLGSDQGGSPKIGSIEDQPSSSKLKVDEDGWQVYMNKKSQKGIHPTLFSTSSLSARKSRFRDLDKFALMKDQVQNSIDQAKRLAHEEKIESFRNEGKGLTDLNEENLPEETALVEKVKSSKSTRKKGKAKGKGKKQAINQSSGSRSGKKPTVGSSKASADDLALEEALAASKKSIIDRLSPERQEHIKKVVLTMLQKDNPKAFANIFIDMPEYNKLFKGTDQDTEEAMQELILGPVFQDIIDSVGNLEGHRRHRALRDQLDDRVIQQNWNLGIYHNSIEEPIMNVAEALSVKEVFPIFYKSKLGDWETVREKLDRLDVDEFQRLEDVIEYHQVEKRLAMIWAMQEVNQKGDSLFKEAGLKALAIQGINLPMLVSLCDLMGLSPARMVTGEISESALIIKYLRIYRLMHGKFTAGLGDIYEMEDDLNWLESPVRYFLTENTKLKDPFEKRLKSLIREGDGKSIAYIEWCKSIGIEWNPSFEHHQVSLAEALSSAHFGISLDDLIKLQTKIQQHENLKRVMINNQLNHKHQSMGGGGTSLLYENQNHQLYWPKNAEDFLPQFENFRRYFECFGQKLMMSKSRGK
ncbi:uncharacterized protein MELLADRAFT_65535 [Melampsora larici-populina 98AG31]|uniref:Uncharacterized protein n=1 Tax=Melampsora larici-populina (strain 98AG31 / pathotype 3-4-7) TaxID=747676 RepID=F4RVS6_MELLP|nr:uncharacterized protein MELLADRAFT_65535 [Melampsora larici-populina 98AG31]EGG03411.1 hypothetical protein MELLADRAFT_65535 [Melampsora larici-populina 98AG31]